MHMGESITKGQEQEHVHNWGLDPLFYTPLKLLVVSLELLQQTENPSGLFTLYDHPVRRVEVMGVCVERLHVFSTGMLSFVVDDGSGCVPCVYWARTPDGNPSELPISDVKLGHLIRVQGRPSFYQNKLQLNTLHFQVEKDPNSEVLHWLDAMDLFSTNYNKKQPEI
mmetsp:Transcript_29095/g.55909  ORF Transcript_29095/g.55909 Transcript_29095/m.55909 type:complete len:167 (-) Transcript_29095:326-826(-)|eukprot:CAMPEP_0114257090 /NCGR_PEP_ID=MMETSP0058-20121206/18530_1 /TAXON_ID=36894 /ORGANISM="Pyramimonas parkeae, CCMP726" /LENGTH=166 /DNA_ID=CAMNT_0001371759 /DNA_START=374 /DNA_END=874 /DNA_ORIENTATION=-